VSDESMKNSTRTLERGRIPKGGRSLMSSGVRGARARRKGEASAMYDGRQSPVQLVVMP
jgi:hypothetical protein